MIRKMQPADLPALRELFNTVRTTTFFWEPHHRYAVIDFDEVTRDESVLVLEIKGKIIGFSGIYVPENFIHSLYILPQFAGCGYGSQLLSASLALISTPAHLKVVSKNIAAIKFYEKNSWIKVCENVSVAGPYWLMEYTAD